MPIKRRDETPLPESPSFSLSSLKRPPVAIPLKGRILPKIDAYKEVVEETECLYGDSLLPEDIRRDNQHLFNLYDVCERVFPTTGIPAILITTALASMCTSEPRQFNLLIGKETGEGGTLIIQQFSQIPFVRAIFDSVTAAGFCMEYCGYYLITSRGSNLPIGVKLQKGGKIDKAGCKPIHQHFFISKGMDKLFHQSPKVVEKTLTFFNPLFEEGYGTFSDAYSGTYEIGSKNTRLKIGFIGVCTLDDFENYALKASGWTERIVMTTWRTHSLEDKEVIIKGITRKKFPEVDMSIAIANLLQHLNPEYPWKIESWGEEVAQQLDRFSEHCRKTRGERKGKRAARDATRILQSLPTIERRNTVCFSDLAIMDGISTTMRRNPEPMGWRIPFQYSIRRWFQRDDEIVRDLRKLFLNWKGQPIYSDDVILKAIKTLKSSEAP